MLPHDKQITYFDKRVGLTDLSEGQGWRKAVLILCVVVVVGESKLSTFGIKRCFIVNDAPT